MTRMRLGAFLICVAGVGIGFFVFLTERPDNRFHFKLGLDLAGGTELIYRADVSAVPGSDANDAMAALRDVIERRVNLFGVSEPRVVVSRGSVLGDGGAEERDERLLVELPGVTDTDEAIALIGETPLLEFKLLAPIEESGDGNTEFAPRFLDTGLTGRYLTRADVQFSGDNLSRLPGGTAVGIQFNSEGAALFERITREHTGEVLAIFLDGAPVSLPVIQDTISGGRGVITGNFTPEEARDLVRDLNIGALPVPITLLAANSVGASLGADAVAAGVRAGMGGLVAVAIFLVAWYRLRGAVAVFSLAFYCVIMLAIFKLIPVTLTAAGIAGFVLSIGMAVDANILIFERIKEELASRASRREAVISGFSRAWLSIRDANISTVLTGVILFWLGTSVVQGFALTLTIGVLVSMITAIGVSKTFLLAIIPEEVKSQKS